MIERYTLKNGIPVFVVENHAAPVVSVQAWIGRGSAYETDKVAGISHFLEHSLFKGTKRERLRNRPRSRKLRRRDQCFYLI